MAHLAVDSDFASSIVVTWLVPEAPVVHHAADSLVLHAGAARLARIAAGGRQRRTATLAIATLEVAIPDHLLAACFIQNLQPILCIICMAPQAEAEAVAAKQHRRLAVV